MDALAAFGAKMDVVTQAIWVGGAPTFVRAWWPVVFLCSLVNGIKDFRIKTMDVLTTKKNKGKKDNGQNDNSLDLHFMSN